MSAPASPSAITAETLEAICRRTKSPRRSNGKNQKEQPVEAAAK